MTESTYNPLSGLWKPLHLQRMHYGPGTVKEHLLSCLPSSSSKAFIVTGSSLATKTALIRQVEEILGKDHHAGTFSKIKQHTPVAELDEATDSVQKDSNVDTVISVGGGSPIDSAKAISYRLHEKSGKFLYHIAIPTTLSAAECTSNAGYTNREGKKVAVGRPECAPHVIIYDATFARETPQRLWLSTGLRALDHAVELLYDHTATEVPCKQMTLQAAHLLFDYLPKSKADPGNEDYITYLQLASFASLAFRGGNVKGSLGLSHTLGYALGSPYSIPHGITSCLTLGHVVKLKAQNPDDAAQIARALPFIGQRGTGNNEEDASRVGDAILQLVRALGLETNLKEYDVGEDQAAIIAKTATGSEGGRLYDQVFSLVKNLY